MDNKNTYSAAFLLRTAKAKKEKLLSTAESRSTVSAQSFLSNAQWLLVSGTMVVLKETMKKLVP